MNILFIQVFNKILVQFRKHIPNLKNISLSIIIIRHVLV